MNSSTLVLKPPHVIVLGISTEIVDGLSHKQLYVSLLTLGQGTHGQIWIQYYFQLSITKHWKWIDTLKWASFSNYTAGAWSQPLEFLLPKIVQLGPTCETSDIP